MDRPPSDDGRDARVNDDEWEQGQLSRDDFADGRDVDEAASIAAHRDPVGYKRPPKRTQFKPGQSGNPTGRRKAPLPVGLAQAMAQNLNKTERIRRNGRTEILTRAEIIAERFVGAGLTGSVKEMKMILETFERVGAHSVGDELRQIREAEAERSKGRGWTSDMEKRFRAIEAEYFENLGDETEPDEVRPDEEPRRDP